MSNFSKEQVAIIKHCFHRAQFNLPRTSEEYKVLRRLNMITTYMGSLPKCNIPNCNATARYDANLAEGIWGYVCHSHARSKRIGMGLGLGQALITQAEYEVLTDGN